MTTELVLLALVGFLAQLVDGALGMAFGLISTTFMLTVGLPPAHASAVVHTAEVATAAVAGTSHLVHRNVNRILLFRLALAGVAGGILGAYILSNVEGRAIRPFVAAYLLLMGTLILMRAARAMPSEDARPGYAAPLGLVGGFLDAIGGGGWGPLVTSTLIGSGHAPRHVIGSVSVAEFFVTTAVAGTFFAELGGVYLPHVAALAAGGVLAAPLAGFVVKHVRPRLLMTAVGLLVTGLAVRELVMALGR
jgi:uncharacterized membrane protein YfcA